LTCSEADRVLHAYVDGELAATDRAAYEAHLHDCAACTHASRFQARFKAALRGHLPRPALPVGLRSRVEAALGSSPFPRRRWLWQAYPRAFTVAVAAAVAVILMVGNMQRGVRSPVLEQAVSTFHRDLPFDVLSESCAKVSDWFRGRLDFAVQPTTFAGPGARCQGGRLVNVRDHFGAYVVYEVPAGHRLGMMVFPSGSEPLAGSRQRILNGRPVYLDTRRGVSTVTLREPSGLDYVFTADLDEEALANWVEKVYLGR
ncbi:MAG: zf-HC2 domain-containing protein, partial [Polyangia bacterium]